jgi:hypothetical protein
LKKIDLIFKGIIIITITHTLDSKDLPLTDAEKLVATKTKSDMTYKQMMQRMGEAFKMIQTGIFILP